MFPGVFPTWKQIRYTREFGIIVILLPLMLLMIAALVVAHELQGPKWDLDAEGIVYRSVDAELYESYTFTIVGADEQLKLTDVGGILFGIDGHMLIRGLKSGDAYVVCEAEGVGGRHLYQKAQVSPCPAGTPLPSTPTAPSSK